MAGNVRLQRYLAIIGALRTERLEMKKTTLAFVFFASLVTPSIAHEYWIEPVQFTVSPGEAIQGDLKNGQDFKGVKFPYIPDRFEKFTLTGPGGSQPVEARIGDRPALNMVPDEPGLYSATYQSIFDHITFKENEKIRQYIEYEGLDGAYERHLERGLSPDRFQERYARCAKALFQVGEPSDGKDRLTGMKFEWVAEGNPYMLSPSEDLTLRLYWEGEPLANKHVNIFHDDGTAVERTTMRTDAAGRIDLPLTGGGKFMINAVKLLEGDEDPETDLPEWTSYWASMTFGLKRTDTQLGN